MLTKARTKGKPRVCPFSPEDGWMLLALMFMAGGILGVIAENMRKRSSLLMDAERGVTFIDGVPYLFQRYGPEQHYPEN